MDLMFIVDGSGSVGERNFEKIKSFLKKIVDTTVVGRDQSRIGLIQFSSTVNTEFSLNQFTTAQQVKGKILGPVIALCDLFALRRLSILQIYTQSA